MYSRFDRINETGDKDVVDIRVPKKDDDNRLMGHPINKIEFEKDTLDILIII